MIIYLDVYTTSSCEYALIYFTCESWCPAVHAESILRDEFFRNFGDLFPAVLGSERALSEMKTVKSSALFIGGLTFAPPQGYFIPLNLPFETGPHCAEASSTQ